MSKSPRLQKTSSAGVAPSLAAVALFAGAAALVGWGLDRAIPAAGSSETVIAATPLVVVTESTTPPAEVVDKPMQRAAPLPATATPAAPPPAEPQPTMQPTSAVMAWTAPPTLDRSGPPLQCAIYARQRSGVSLTGAARTWWTAAEGRYVRSKRPSLGSVMAMRGTAAGHVAVVSRILSEREILIDHANWLGQGEIQANALVRDVSDTNDWSRVVVWHVPSNGLGVKPFPVDGFIGPAAVG